MLEFQDKNEWRNWLLQNHDKEREAWLIFYKKNSGKTGMSYNAALEEALCFGWIDGKLKSVDDDKYVIRYSPRKSRSVWSRINREKAEQLIAQGKMTDAGLAKVAEAKRNGSWEAAYTNRIKDVLPADLEAALSANRTALANFQGFANSYRNMYIGWVTGARTEETRKKRIAEVVERSILNKKPGM